MRFKLIFLVICLSLLLLGCDTGQQEQINNLTKQHGESFTKIYQDYRSTIRKYCQNVSAENLESVVTSQLKESFLTTDECYEYERSLYDILSIKVYSYTEDKAEIRVQERLAKGYKENVYHKEIKRSDIRKYWIVHFEKENGDWKVAYFAPPKYD